MSTLEPDQVYFQAHRGSVDEAPENTLAAFQHAWRFPGAVPETDARTTRDGELICLHDATLARTTNAPQPQNSIPVAQLTLAEIREWDAGIRFGPDFAGSRVPTLREVFALMQGRPERQLYLEIKGAALDQIRQLVDEYGLAQRMLFISSDQQVLRQISVLFPGRPTMTWISGAPEAIQTEFERVAATEFAGISQLQLHLEVRPGQPKIEFMLGDDFLKVAQNRLHACGAVLQVRPFAFDGPSLQHLLDLGIRWFVTDSPERFSQALHARHFHLARTGNDPAMHP